MIHLRGDLGRFPKVHRHVHDVVERVLALCTFEWRRCELDADDQDPNQRERRVATAETVRHPLPQQLVGG